MGSVDTSVYGTHVFPLCIDDLAEQHCLSAPRASWVAFLNATWQCKDTPHAVFALSFGLRMLAQLP